MLIFLEGELLGHPSVLGAESRSISQNYLLDMGVKFRLENCNCQKLHDLLPTSSNSHLYIYTGFFLLCLCTSVGAVPVNERHFPGMCLGWSSSLSMSVPNDLPRQALHQHTVECWQSLISEIHLDSGSGQGLLKQGECCSSDPNCIAYMQTGSDKQPKFS